MRAPLPKAAEPSLASIARAWGRIGATGFGGPPAHIALLRALCVERRRWLSAAEFERALAAVNLLPGPASTQLAIYCAWRLRGAAGALLGGVSFILPGLAAIIALSALFLSGSPPAWVRGAGAGAGAAVAPVALGAGLALAGPQWRRAAAGRRRVRVLAYALAGAAGAASAGPFLVLVLVACGVLEALAQRRALSALAGTLAAAGPRRLASAGALALGRAAAAAPAGAGALAWTALKVGALSFGGGFVIVPLMQADAVSTYHWLSHAQFVSAVALGQVTPGPVLHTVAAVGYGAAGLAGALLAALVAFAPSFCFVLLGAPRLERMLARESVAAFLAGAAPAATGAIMGSAIPLAGALSEAWQYGVLAAAALALLAARRPVVPTLLAAGAAGVLAAVLGAPLPR